MATSGRQATGTVEAALAHAARLAQTRPDLALAQAQEVLRVAPGHPQAQLLAGRAQRLSGDIAAARTTLQTLAADQPRSAATAYELGLTAQASGDETLALAELRRAVALKPDFAEAWTALADSLRLAGDDEAADDARLASIRAGTRDPELARAAMALIDNDLPTAETLLRARLHDQPTDVAAIRMMAELAVRVGRTRDAINLLTRALELAPQFHGARELLARTLQRSNRPIEALAAVDRLLQADPRHPGWLILRAALLVRVGDQEGARAVYADVLDHHPRQPKGWMSYGHVLKTLGRREEAEAAYRTALDQQPTLGEVWWSLANLKTFRFSEADIAALRAGLERTDVEEDRLHLLFALGKALEDAGEDEAAFAAYEEGNRIRHGQADYDPGETHDQCVRQAQFYTSTFLSARAGGGYPAPDPIFIVGLPRAGSTLVEQILSSHSLIEGTGELPDMMTIAARLAARIGEDGAQVRYPEMLAALPPERLRELGEAYIEGTRVHRREGKPFFIDKMPNNWLHAGLIMLLLPNAKIIDARRHPLGCGWSGYKQNFARGQAFTYDQGDLGRYYRDYVAFMAHLDRVAPGRVHRVIYEDMVADTEAQVRALLDHVGLPFEEGCLAFHRNTRAVRTASSEQVRRPIFSEGVDHWRRFERWLGPLKAALGTVLDAYPAVPADLDFQDDGHETRAAQGTEEAGYISTKG